MMVSVQWIQNIHLCLSMYYTEVFTRNHIPIWIGKNARSNDILTFQLAHPNDLWFHAKDTPGAHVVLRTEGTIVPTPADIQDASDYARRHSKASSDRNAPVTRASIHQLFKTKYDKPGQVRIQQHI